MRGFYQLFVDMSTGMAGLGDCESLFTHLRSAKTVAEKYLICHSLGTQQALGNRGLGNAYWLPGIGNPADGPTFMDAPAGHILS